MKYFYQNICTLKKSVLILTKWLIHIVKPTG
jgi:hypothetical protein